jgi:hypothetical protein
LNGVGQFADAMFNIIFSLFLFDSTGIPNPRSAVR